VQTVSTRFRALWLVVFGLAAATQTHAQVAPNSVVERFRTQTTAITRQAAADEAMLSGDSDLILLRRTQLITVHGSVSGSFTSNAFLSPTDSKADGLALLDAGIRVATRIGDRVDVFADVGVLGVRYRRYGSLDYSALTGQVGAQASFGRLGVEVSYQPSIIYDRGFSKRQLTQHRFQVWVSSPFRFKALTIEPSASVERVLSSPSDYRNWAGSAQLAVSYPLSHRTPLMAFATGGYEHRDYDSYFPDLVGVRRTDNKLEASVGVQWRPRPWASVALQYSWQHNRSTSDVNGYTAHSGLVGLSGQFRF
jgi:hypothetical protein